MPWNPEIYNDFKNIRYQPFFDLMKLISENHLKTAIDLGCGTGEQTKILSDNFENTTFLGIDSSKEMLEKSKSLEKENLSFVLKTTEEIIAENKKWDLIFSNAALQWSDNHEQLFSDLINLLNKNGQFAVQMPMQNDNILNQILLELAQEKPFINYLNNWKRETPMLKIDQYAQIMFDGGLENINVTQKVYPIIAGDVETLFNFINGSALIPYLERLDESQKKEFTEKFKEEIGKKFTKFPALYSFKRLLLYGVKK